MSDKNLKIAASLAGLTPTEKDKIDTLSKALNTHKSLLDMPAADARTKFQSLPADQQQSLTQTFGTEPEEKKRGWLSSAWHYTGGALVSGLNEVSDFMTRAGRTYLIANEQIPIGSSEYYLPKNWSIISEAWKKSNDNGEIVYNDSRINNAIKKYGNNYVSLAQKVSEGKSLVDLIATGTEEEKQIAALAAKNQDPLWQDAYDAVVAAKYSPGRAVANILPESLEGTGFLYKGISGTTDAAFRIFADPTILLGKAKKAYDAANYAIIKIAGDPKKLDAAFSNPKVVNFFNSYGSELDTLAKARKSKNIVAAEQASTTLRRIAPEFGPAAIDEFISAGVTNADTAKAYFQNSVDVQGILKGQAARETPLIPRLTTGRKVRIAALTTGNKVLNVDKIGQKLVKAMYGAAPQFEDVLTGITTQSERIADLEKGIGRIKGPDGVVRFTENQIQGRIDRFARKFTKVPNPTSKVFDVMGAGAVDEIYRTARLTNSRYHSKIIAEAFAAGDEGQRMQITKGLWNTIFSTRGVRKGDPGKSFMDEFAGKGLEKRYAADLVIDGKRLGNPSEFDGEQLALFPYQLSSSMVIPSVVDLDRIAGRQGLVSQLVGVSHNKWIDKITSGWSFLTLAGPRFAIRNSIEDDMFYLARGRNPWDLVKGKLWSTRVRVGKGVNILDADGNAKTALDKLKDIVFLNVESGEVGAINKFILADELEEFAVKVANAANEDEVRSVMAEALIRRKLGYKLDPESAEIIADVAKYGNLDNLLADVTEGTKNGARGGGRYQNITDDVSRFGKMDAITIDNKAYRRSMGDIPFTNFSPVANEQSKVSWLFQLGVMANDEIGRIAFKNLNNEEKGIREIFDYLKSLPQRDRDRFQLYYKPGEDEYTHAQRAFLAAYGLLTKADGKLNEDLWSKIVKTDADGYVRVTAKDLRLADLPNDPKLAPSFISGPTLVPVSEADNFAASIWDKGWDAMGEANARWTREPIVLNELVRFRKQLDESGYSQKVIDQLTAGKTDEAYEKAYKVAKRHINETAEDLAKDSVLAYVDNPAVRSQLAMSGRNFARFYRATEDFYRRFYRTVKYNPEAITRASLTYDGIAHSGFVQTDDTGEQYFFYPGTTAMYQAMGKTMQFFGQEEGIKAPMPIEFSAKLKMITPSTNPDSLFPTFAGPLSAIAMKAIFNVVPALDKFEKVLLGQYAEDQPMINAIFPAHITRFLSTMDRDERVSQYASASRKAAAYLEATGHGLTPKIDPVTGQEIDLTVGELEDYKDKLAASTITALSLRFILGFFVPAAPQTTLKSEIATWVRQNGETNFKQTFNNLVTKTGSYDKAMQEWIRLFPKEIPYTVSESDSTVVAILSANKKANEWVTDNKELIKKYPEGAGFFIPKEGEFDFDAYKLLSTMGLKKSKLVDDYLREVNTARDEAFYYAQQDLYEEELSSTFSDYAKRNLKTQWETWSKQYKKARPNLQEEMGKGAETAIKRNQALSDLTTMLLDPSVKVDPAVRQPIEGMLVTYNNYVNARDSVFGNTQSAQNYKDMLKQRAKQELERLSKTNRNAEDAYFALFSKLIRD